MVRPLLSERSSSCMGTQLVSPVTHNLARYSGVVEEVGGWWRRREDGGGGGRVVEEEEGGWWWRR